MKKNKLTVAVLSLALAGTMVLPALAFNAQPAQANGGKSTAVSSVPISSNYTVEVNGKRTEIEPIIMVPLRAIAEELGFKITWNNGSILVDNGILHTVVTIGMDSYCLTTSQEGMVGMSAPFSLGAVPYATNGVTYVPLELFRALLGNRDDIITVDGGKILITTADANTQIPNPFVTCATLEEAAKLTGFSLSVPEKPTDYTDCKIQVIHKEMIQVGYSKGDVQTLLLRKASGTEDISGDYTAYPETNTMTVGTLTVTTKGEDGKVSVATWTDECYTYSIAAQAVPMSTKEVSQLVANIH